MTMPNEEKSALKRSHKFLSDILAEKRYRADFANMTKEEFEAWRRQCYSCIRHYPFDCHIDKMYEARGVPREG